MNWSLGAMAKLIGQRCGKGHVRVLKILRDGPIHTIKEIDVTALLTGDFASSYTAGDNTKVVPTDTMKNTINALAQQHLGEEIERFALTLGKHFLTRSHETLATLRDKTPLLKTYSLREGETDSFCSICGGEVTVLVEPQNLNEAIFLIGGGHCSHAIAKLSADCGLFVTVVDDRSELTKDLPANVGVVALTNPAEFIRNRKWQSDEALVIVSRNYEIDRDAWPPRLRFRESVISG
jgi:hypothetical protein